MFVCFLGGFFILFLFSCSTAKQCLQNGVNGETALRWVFSTSVSPSAEGTRTYSMQRQTLAECLWKHRHDEAIFGPSRCSQIRPRSTKQIPSSFPTIQEDMDGFQKYGSKYIFEVKEIFWITSMRGSEMSLFWPNLIVNREIGSTTQREEKLAAWKCCHCNYPVLWMIWTTEGTRFWTGPWLNLIGCQIYINVF